MAKSCMICSYPAKEHKTGEICFAGVHCFSQIRTGRDHTVKKQVNIIPVVRRLPYFSSNSVLTGKSNLSADGLAESLADGLV